MKKTLALLLAFMLCLGLASCNWVTKSAKRYPALVGEWTQNPSGESLVILNGNGTCLINGIEGKWSVNFKSSSGEWIDLTFKMKNNCEAWMNIGYDENQVMRADGGLRTEEGEILFSEGDPMLKKESFPDLNQYPLLIGEWTADPSSAPTLVLKDDGTCTFRGQTAKWFVRYTPWMSDDQYEIAICNDGGIVANASFSLDDEDETKIGWASISIPAEEAYYNLYDNSIFPKPETCTDLLGQWTCNPSGAPALEFLPDGTCSFFGANARWFVDARNKYHNGYLVRLVKNGDEIGNVRVYNDDDVEGLLISDLHVEINGEDKSAYNLARVDAFKPVADYPEFIGQWSYNIEEGIPVELRADGTCLINGLEASWWVDCRNTEKRAYIYNADTKVASFRIMQEEKFDFPCGYYFPEEGSSIGALYNISQCEIVEITTENIMDYFSIVTREDWSHNASKKAIRLDIYTDLLINEEYERTLVSNLCNVVAEKQIQTGRSKFIVDFKNETYITKPVSSNNHTCDPYVVTFSSQYNNRYGLSLYSNYFYKSLPETTESVFEQITFVRLLGSLYIYRGVQAPAGN